MRDFRDRKLLKQVLDDRSPSLVERLEKLFDQVVQPCGVFRQGAGLQGVTVVQGYLAAAIASF